MTRATVTWTGNVAAGLAHDGAARGLLLGMEHVLGESKKVVPLDEGPLDRSGTASVDEGRLVGAVSYDTPYAEDQHENMTYNHLPGRTAKYLELPMAEETPTVLDLVAAEIRRALR
ncbi:hypothetical protein B4N89_20555 [Embleya scabrispora]|uniref:HK97 gp10 family phage protein n=1 Tax=Embleya scabrispora TaxID=159449 RepID=A0A1T3P1N2_9ACTN|nr:hypothetical protein [Embleya scabrispora]OPC83007.1 hypothetical protein B4N89_20555 [Embleya scabrispora]